MDRSDRQKTILVTGAAGFIGSNLCASLLASGSRVIGADNLYSGMRENAACLEQYPDFRFIEQDICEVFEPGEPVDEIYHLACPASPPYYQRDPIFTAKTCFTGSLNMLELAKANNARILLTSTSEVYGNPLEHPQKETYWGNVNPDGVRSCYDEGKRIAETLFFDHSRQYGTDIRVVRIFNTYGPHMKEDDGRVVSNLIIQAIKGEPMTVYGDGTQTRSFCYVDDTVRGLTRMMANGSFTGPVNIGNPEEVTVTQLADTIKRLTGSVSEKVFRGIPKDDPVKRRPDISVAYEKLGWAPTVKLEDGLGRTIEYFSGRIEKDK
ncbi:MAG: SDR family oxidoreductase [Oscillospiraceae bacterium]|nr:SDR family oxidoreductase [Oscillospiraceae bacterium]